MLTTKEPPRHPGHENGPDIMSNTELLDTQHAAYERDLEPPFYGIDNCPFDDLTPLDFGSDMTFTVPCAYCGFTDCHHDDAGGPYAHINARRGW